MKLMIAMLGLSLSVCAFAQNTYTYKDNNGKIFLTNVAQSGNVAIPKTNNNEGRIVIQSGERDISFDTPTLTKPFSDDELDNAIQRLTELTSTNNYDNAENIEYESYDKRQTFYYDWHYLKQSDDFNEDARIAMLLSNNGGYAALSLTYTEKDKKFENPYLGIFLSNKFDGENLHQFLCYDNCTVDINIDGKKYPNVKVERGGVHILLFKNPKTVLNYIKKGETIKIRLQSITGNPLIYVFEPNNPLSLQALKELE